MDLQKRALGFLEAMSGKDPAAVLAYFAPHARYDFSGALELAGRDHIDGFIETVRHNLAAIGVQKLEFRSLRNVTEGRTSFAEWECTSFRSTGPVIFRGVLILSWNTDAQVDHVCVYMDPEAVRRVAIGISSRMAPSETAN